MLNRSVSVSVVIPTFNRGDLVVGAIESVLSQTYQDYEVIVIDDGSTDNTRDRLRPYLERIQYIHQENHGASAAQNRGIQRAVGEWISILASDDTWLPTKLESQMKAVRTMGSEFGACFTNCSFVGDPTRTLTAFQEADFHPCSGVGQLYEPLRWVLAHSPILWVQSLMIKRLLMLENGGFDSQLVVAEDTDLLFRLSFKTKFCFVNQALVNVDVMPDRTDRLSFLYTAGDDRAFSSKEFMFQKWLHLLKDRPDRILQKSIGELLSDIYYRWAKQSMVRGEWSKFFKSIGKLSRCGVGYTKLLGMFFSTGIKKIKQLVRLSLPVR
jgi:glycosyltransferase involved in cell wall biosynthesis